MTNPENQALPDQPTVFEKVWSAPNTHFLFKSEKYGLMIVADTMPKFTYQVVVAPSSGSAENDAHFYRLPLAVRQALHLLADAVALKILELSSQQATKELRDDAIDSDDRVVTHIEGFAVRRHPHIVVFGGVERGESKRLHYDTTLGSAAVQNTIQNIVFTDAEVKDLEAKISGLFGLFGNN